MLAPSIAGKIESPVVTCGVSDVMDHIRELHAIALNLHRRASWPEIHAANDNYANAVLYAPKLADGDGED